MSDNPVAVIAHTCHEDREQRRARLFELEHRLGDFDQIELPIRHFFHGFTYMREMTIPKGALLVGRIHLFDHFEILISGDITVSTDTSAPTRYSGYTVLKGMAGKKRAFYAHEESIFITVHSAEEREPDEMFNYMTCNSFEEFDQFHQAMLENMGGNL